MFDKSTCVATVGAIGAATVAAWIARKTVRCLGDGEQLYVHKFTGTNVHNGPCIVALIPFTYRSTEKVQVDAIGVTEYARVQNAVSGIERILKGPQPLFLLPNEIILSKDNAVCLVEGEYILVTDKLTTISRMEKGPCVYFPTSHESASLIQKAIVLQEDEYIHLKDSSTGHHWVERGKKLVYMEPTWKIKQKTEKAWVLKVNEYIRFLDKTTGKITVHRGEKMVFPGPDEVLLDTKVQKAKEVDDQQAVLVRDETTGLLHLVTEKQLYFPQPNEVIVEVRNLIKLSDHEAIITKDKDGVFHYFYGDDKKRAADQSRSFFLPPYHEIVSTKWSRGARREVRDLVVQRFSFRPHLLRIEFKCRTADHVELVVEGVVAWDMVDLPTMFCTTGDPPGDICYHVRSQFVREVSRVTLKVFMDELHEISKRVIADPSFFTERGMTVNALDVGRYRCADRSTSAILEQIILETTNRMNRLSQAESENEVNLFRTCGQTEEMRLKDELLKIQHEQTQSNAQVTGKAEAHRVASFLTALEAQVPSLEERIQMWQVLRKTDALSVVSKGDASIYFTPSDVNLAIETKSQKPH